MKTKTKKQEVGQKVYKVTLEFTELGERQMTGFHQNWISGTAGKHPISLDCGAGCGNQGLWLKYKDKRYSTGIMSILQPLVNQIDGKSEVKITPNELKKVGFTKCALGRYEIALPQCKTSKFRKLMYDFPDGALYLHNVYANLLREAKHMSEINEVYRSLTGSELTTISKKKYHESNNKS